MTAEPSNGVVRERKVLIPMEVGVELAADLSLPDCPGPHPTLVSFYPYRKDDNIGATYAYSRSYFSLHGYASLLVDFRGTGNSSGDCHVTFDTPLEAADGARVVEWAAEQDWCDGNIGVWGLSYGGIMSLAVAAQRPPHLKAIGPMQGTPDIHRDFMAPGGCPNCLGTNSWVSLMLAFDLAPPTLPDRDGRWIRVWRQRLARLERGDIWPLEWQRHVDHDEYWQSKEIALERIEVPTFAIGGWRDIFPQAMTDTYHRVAAPKKLLMGPWVHSLPDAGEYAAVDWLPEMRRFFDRWVRGEQNGIDSEPPVTLYIQGAERWRRESEWPIARTRLHDWYLHPGGALATAPAAETEHDRYTADPTVGTCSALWDPLGTGLGYPRDQGEDDLRSLTYTSDPLEEDLEITGSPEASLHVALEDGDELQLVAKLNAVSPDGRSTMITTGCLNAAYRLSDDHARPPEQGVVEEYRLKLWAASYLIPKGSRLRLSIACADFPRIWPLHSSPTICVDAARSVVRIPVVPASPGPVDEVAPAVPDPAVDRWPWHVAPEPEPQPSWRVERDVGSDDATVTQRVTHDLRLPDGGSFRVDLNARAHSPPVSPAGAHLVVDVRIDVRRATGERAEVRVRNRFTRDTTLMSGEVTLDGTRVFEGRWREHS